VQLPDFRAFHWFSLRFFDDEKVFGFSIVKLTEKFGIESGVESN
jgi:hypothetical protein